MKKRGRPRSLRTAAGNGSMVSSERSGTAEFRRESSMRHGFLRLKGETKAEGPGSGASAGPGDFEAPMATLDSLLAARPALQGRRVFLKIDTEGLEPEVVAGARDLLDSGRVAAVIWSRGRRFDREADRNRLLAMMDGLKARGYRHCRMPHDVLGGALMPFVFGHELCNVFSLAKDFKPLPAYPRPAGSWIAPPRPSSVTLPRSARVAWTELLMEARATDGGRWADPAGLDAGAAERAQMAAGYVQGNSHVVDLGAGTMALGKLLVGKAIYQPVDLVARADNTIVCDLNQERWPDSPPEGYYDLVTVMHLLEHLHDPAVALKRCRDLAGRMVLTYRHPADPEAEREGRRAEGIFNDLSPDELRAALKAAGWVVAEDKDLGADRVYVCRAA
ncbi:MAG: FkbM family methyltransferase [Alphaproteobacteria bacterium]|nr:FkbM family methyltransferase [Alphaproteobacteria bacterium]